MWKVWVNWNTCVRIHFFLFSLSHHSALHDLRCTAPVMGQYRSISATPLSQVQTFTAKVQCERVSYDSAPVVYSYSWNLQAHSVLASFICKPAWHDAHFAAPRVRMYPGMRDTVLARAGVHCTKTNKRHTTLLLQLRAWAWIRTNTLDFLVIDCPPSVTRHTLRNTIRGTMHPGLRHAVHELPASWKIGDVTVPLLRFCGRE